MVYHMLLPTSGSVVQRRAGVVAFGAKLLEHDRGGVALEPAPAQLAVVDPLLFHFEAEAVGVEADGVFDVGDAEEGNCQLDVVDDFGIEFCAGVHSNHLVTVNVEPKLKPICAYGILFWILYCLRQKAQASARRYWW
jgi:hypothetical protein